MMDDMKLTVGQSLEVVLPQRGSSGFSLLHCVSAEGIVVIEGPEAVGPQGRPPGDPVDQRFIIRALQPGTVRILFYETRIWDKGFPALPVREWDITVSAPA